MFREWWQSFPIQNLNFHFSLAVPSAILRICLLLQQFGWCPPRNASWSKGQPPFSFFSRCKLLNILYLIVTLGQANTIFFFVCLASYCNQPELPNSSELIHPGGGRHHHLVNLYPQSPPPTSLGFYFYQDNVTQRAWAPFPKNWPRRSTRALRVSWKLKASAAATVSPRTCSTPPDKWGKTQG